MTHLIIVCEGPTEQEFCNDVLAPFLFKYNVYVRHPVIKHSGGGIVSWGSIRKQILTHLWENGAYVTLFVDYYGIKDSFAYPGWEESKTIDNKYDRMHFLFDRMSEDIPEDLRARFIPYLQLHEFEGLLFSDLSIFKYLFDENDVDIDSLQEAVDTFTNPELINNGPNTAPSKRLIDAIPSYNKVLYGSMLAEAAGLNSIRQKCPLFNEWVERLSHCSSS